MTSLAEDFEVQPQGDRQVRFSSTTIINGVMERIDRRGREFLYELTPRRPGTLTIGPITATVDGKPLKSELLTLKVQRPEVQDIALVELSADRTEVYPFATVSHSD